MSNNTALLVIDMQNDFIKKDVLLEVKGIRAGIPRLAAFIDSCRQAKLPIIYTRHCYDPKNNPIEAKLFKFRKNTLRKGLEGWKIYATLKPAPQDTVIDKTRYDAFFKTRLHQILKQKHIKNLIITGTMTEICCESTARTAMFYDYNIFFCKDLTFTSDKLTHDNTLKVIKHHFGAVVSSPSILKKLW